MGTVMIIFSIIVALVQWRTHQVSTLLHMNQIYIYFFAFLLLLGGIVIEIDAKRK